MAFGEDRYFLALREFAAAAYDCAALLAENGRGVSFRIDAVLRQLQGVEDKVFRQLRHEFLPPIEREDIAALIFSFGAAAAACAAAQAARPKAGPGSGAPPAAAAITGAAEKLSRALERLRSRKDLPKCLEAALAAKKQLAAAVRQSGSGWLTPAAEKYLAAAETLIIVCLKNS